jgi:putative transposase
MKLSEWLKQEGVHYQTAWGWFRDGKLPVPATRTPSGTIPLSEGACHWRTRSRRSKKTQARLAKAHAKAASIRGDAIDKASHEAATSYAVNVVEDLNAEGIGRKAPKKRGFNRSAKDAALGELRRQMAYKCRWYRSSLSLADRWYPSSKLCSTCRTKNANLPRSARVFRCDACGLAIERDLNAAKNLAALAELACVCHGTVDDRATGRLVPPPYSPIGLGAGSEHLQFAGVCPSQRPQGRWRGEEDRPATSCRGPPL